MNWEQVFNIIQSSFFSKEHLKKNLPLKTIYQWLLDDTVKLRGGNYVITSEWKSKNLSNHLAILKYSNQSFIQSNKHNPIISF